MGIIEEKWLYFEKMLLKGASDFQKVEMKKAFYAGCAAMFDSIIRTSELGEKEGFTTLEMMQEELRPVRDRHHRDGPCENS